MKMTIAFSLVLALAATSAAASRPRQSVFSPPPQSVVKTDSTSCPAGICANCQCQNGQCVNGLCQSSVQPPSAAIPPKPTTAGDWKWDGSHWWCYTETISTQSPVQNSSVIAAPPPTFSAPAVQQTQSPFVGFPVGSSCANGQCQVQTQRRR